MALKNPYANLQNPLYHPLMPFSQGGDTSTIQQEQKVRQLFGEVGKQGDILTGVGLPPKETVKKQKTPWLAKIFDVISRPLYAAEGLVEGLVEGDSKAFKHAGQGLWGTRKKTFSKLIAEKTKGVPVLGNKVSQAILGFAADVVGDPLTYASLGTNLAAKKGAEVTAKSAIAQAAKDVGESTTAKIIKAAEEQAVQRGLGPKAAERLVETRLNDLTPKVEGLIKSASDAAAAANPIPVGKAQFKIFGKTVAESEKAFKVGSAAAKQLGKSKTLRSAYRLLSTSARMPSHVKSAALAATNKGYFELENLYKEIQREMSSALVDPATGQRLARSQVDRIMEQVPQMIEDGSIRNASPVHRQLADIWEKYRSNFFQTEYAHGLHDAGDELSNYVYHVYRNSEEAERYGLGVYGRKHVGTENPPFTNRRQIPSIQAAEAAGLDPIKRLDEILAYRAQKHYEVMSRANFIDKVKEFGVKLPDDPRARSLVEKELKGRGYRAADSKFLDKVDGKDAWYFDKDVADSIKFAEKITARDPAAQHFVRMFDRVQNNWKFLAAVANPGAQVKNLYGDVFSNFMAGVVNPKRYKQAMKIVGKHRGVRGFNQEAEQVFKIGTERITDRQVDELYTKLGLKSGYTRAEFGGARGVVGRLVEASGVGKVTGLVSKGARGASELREDFGRMALFLDTLHKEGKHIKSFADFEKAGQKAADTVRKYLFDYSDLTRFEKTYLRRVVPFYTFMRKNIPLQLELLATKPGRVSIIPKSLRALQQATGVDSADLVFPGLSKIAPEWLREIGAVRVAENMSGIGGMYAAPDFPFISAVQTLEHPSDILGSISPLLKAPIELKTGQILRSGAKLKEGKVLGSTGKLLPYLLSQIPQYERLIGPRSDLASKIRFATGAPIYNIDAKDILSELRRIQEPMKAATAQRNAERRSVLGVGPQFDFPNKVVYDPRNFKLKHLERLKRIKSLAALGGDYEFNPDVLT